MTDRDALQRELDAALTVVELRSEMLATARLENDGLRAENERLRKRVAKEVHHDPLVLRSR